MTDQTLIRVRYEANADGKGSGGLTFNDERPPLMIGEEGDVTVTEMAIAANAGLVLVPVTDEEATDEPSGDNRPDDQPIDSTFIASNLTLDELKEKAQELGVEFAPNVRHAVLAKDVQDAYDQKQQQGGSAS